MKKKRYVVLDKKVGETPFSVLEKFRIEKAWVGEQKLAYAGRLDPMAEGKLLVLIGDECKNQNMYNALDKEYEFDVLFGFSTDTGDVLGIVTNQKNKEKENVTKKDLSKITKDFLGNQKFYYPTFSSKTVQGKPLFLWTLEGKIGEITIPKADVSIYTLRYKKQNVITKDKLYTTILEKINSIPKVTKESKALGRDFRRKDIRNTWREVFNRLPVNAQFQVVTYSCTCSSGTYMRTLAMEIGKKLGTQGIAYRIRRTKIGKYQEIYRQFGFWKKVY